MFNQFIFKTKKIKGKQWVWNSISKSLFENLCRYFNEDSKCEFNIHQDLILCGGNGIGKSTYMKFFSTITNDTKLFPKRRNNLGVYEYRKHYQVFSASKIVDELELAKDQSVILSYYSIREYAKVCIDEIGAEKESKIWGKEEQPIKRILEGRETNNLLTLGTSNLDLEEMGLKYGQRFSSRMNHMNIIELLIEDDYRELKYN